ncbi:hypothetical protein Tco_0127971 [Tanacetum coccineum]
MNKFMNTIRSPEGILHALIQIVPYSVKRPSFASYGDVVTLKRRRDDQDEDKDEEPSAGPNRGSKRRRAEKEPESTSTPKDKTSKHGKSKKGLNLHLNTSTGKSDQAEEPIHANVDLEEPTHQEFDIGVTKDQPIDETTQLPDWFQKPEKSPTPDRNWNKTLHAAHGPVQPWLSTLAQKEESHSLVELEYFFEEVYKATTDQLDWNNPKGQQYPHDLRKPLPLIPNSRGRQVIPFDHFINNDLVYLSGGVSSRTYTTLVTQTKAADYGDENDNNSMDLLLTGNRLIMYTPNAESLLSQSFKLSNGIITSIWIGSLFVEMIESCINSKRAISKRHRIQGPRRLAAASYLRR